MGEIAAEPYVHEEIAAEPYVDVQIPAEPYIDAQIPAEPYVHIAGAAAPAYVHAAPVAAYAAAPVAAAPVAYAAAPAAYAAAPAWLLPLPPLHTPVTTTASLPVRTLTLATLSPLPSPPLPRNREFHRGRHIGQYFPRLHPDKKSDEHATSD